MTNCAASTASRRSWACSVSAGRRRAADMRIRNPDRVRASLRLPGHRCSARETPAAPDALGSRGAAGRPGSRSMAGRRPPAGSVPPPVGVHGLTAAHGDIVRVRIGLRDAYVLCHPELVRRVSPTHGPSTARDRSTKRSGPLSATASPRVRAPTTEGSAGCSSPPSTTSASNGAAQVMSAEVETLTDRWRSGQVVDAVDEMFRLTTAVAVRTLFSSDFPHPSRKNCATASTSSCAACTRGC